MNPANFHGHGKKPPFFEGWYFKLLDQAEIHRFAVIPGIFLGEDAHAFIQVLDGNTAQSTYHRYPSSKFWASEADFRVRIGENDFSRDSFTLNINDDQRQAVGELRFSGLKPWPVSVSSPGIMGWYAWVPRMECYHGVLSLDHEIEGSLRVNGETVDFSGGRGYIEKDWGQSFPTGYIWLQSNHFGMPGTSLTASIAVIPWLGNAFRGFIVGFLQEGKLYRFATYTGAKTEALTISRERVFWRMRDRRHRLEIVAYRAQGTRLYEPNRKKMLQRVEETMLASVEIKLTTRSGKTIFNGVGKNTALEVNGDLDTLLSMD